jgi:hypothetical protein
MPVGYSELFLEQGASFNTTITLYDVNNLSYNLVGYTANSQIRKSYYSANAVVAFTTSFSNTPADGDLTLSLTYQQTANVAAGRYVYDVYLTSQNQTSRVRVLEGIINVTPSATRI